MHAVCEPDVISEPAELLQVLDRAHAEQLLALGCPHAQGHLFSEPRTTEATEALLASAFERVPSNVRLS